ncbi:MAG: DUF3592 domain-containing protein [Bacilli bacterium]|nr:DUF3592 domain-containing protein [Bacilli bacterium]
MVYALIFGLLFLFVGLFLYIRQKLKLRKCSLFVYAKVKDNVRRRDSNDSSWYYYPVFEYVINNEKYEDVYFAGTTRIKYKEGDEVEIYCNPDNYKEYYVKNDRLPIILSLVFIGISILFFALYFIFNIMSK